jgi:polysaccharide biosynthesis/export protein
LEGWKEFDVARRSLAVLAVQLFFVCGGVFGQNIRPNTEPPATVEKPPEPPKVPNTVAPDATGLPLDPKTYIIGAEDIINIKVWRETEFTGAKGVRPDGKITMPLVGDIQAAGLTPARLADQLKQALSTYLKEPEIEVDVIQVNSKRYTITGGVGRPGPYPLVTARTVFEAINDAGGFREFANKSHITVLRADGTRLFFNYDKYVKGKKDPKNVNVLLENGDTVYVKE